MRGAALIRPVPATVLPGAGDRVGVEALTLPCLAVLLTNLGAKREATFRDW